MVSICEDRDGWDARFNKSHGAPNPREGVPKAEFRPCERHELLDETKIKAVFDKTFKSYSCHRCIAGKPDPFVFWLLADPTDAVSALGCVANKHGKAWKEGV